MGCDIHFYVEKRTPDGWVSADAWEPSPYEDESGRLRVDYKKAFYSGRSYNLFAILADVRNGRGFAGCKTGDGFNPIAEPRGVPEDCCVEYREEAAGWEGDGHSHSYFTLAELLAYDWTQVTTQQGWVNIAEWARWRDKGKPDGWSGGVMGGEVKHLTTEDFEAAWQSVRIARGYPEVRHASAHLCRHGDEEDIEMMRSILGRSAYTLVQWSEPYYEAIGSEFFGKTIPKLLKVAADAGGQDNVRVTFFFDN